MNPAIKKALEETVELIESEMTLFVEDRQKNRAARLLKAINAILFVEKERNERKKS
jgi:hypothetical protein